MVNIIKLKGLINVLEGMADAVWNNKENDLEKSQSELLELWYDGYITDVIDVVDYPFELSFGDINLRKFVSTVNNSNAMMVWIFRLIEVAHKEMKLQETDNDEHRKAFKLTLMDAENGRVLKQQTVILGSKETPFPEDWKNDIVTQTHLQDLKSEFVKESICSDISECLTHKNV